MYHKHFCCVQDPYVSPLRLQIVGGRGFTYSKQEEEKMRDIERCVTIYMYTYIHIMFPECGMHRQFLIPDCLLQVVKTEPPYLEVRENYYCVLKRACSSCQVHDLIYMAESVRYILAIILSRLQALMPPEQWESICSSSSRHSTPSMPLTAEVCIETNVYFMVGLAGVHTYTHVWHRNNYLLP